MNIIHIMRLSDLDLQQLKAFFIVIQTGSFSSAAMRLNRTQSAISHSLIKLEDLIGIQLVDRGGKRAKPTEAGEKLYTLCESIFSSMESLEEDLRYSHGRAEGRIRLGATVEFGSSILMYHIQPFLTAYPKIEVDFYLGNDLLALLVQDDIDIMIDCVDHKLSILEHTPLFQETYMVACSPSYLFANNISKPQDIERCSIISFDKACIWWNRFRNALPKKTRPNLNKVITINHIRGMINAAINNLGIIIVPSYSLKGELDRGSLVSLFPGIRPLEDHFAIYQKKSKMHNLKNRLLKEYMQALRLSEFSVD